MKIVFYTLLAVMALAGFSQRSSAAPLTVYYDQAAWEAAVAGLNVGPYSGGGATTFTNTTISIAPAPDCPSGGLPICIINVQTLTSGGVPSSVSAIMDFPSFTCFDCTRTTRIDIALDTPVLGFAADNFSFTNAILNLNGFGLGSLGSPIPRFFGLVGPISTLSFGSGPCCTDSPAQLDMRNFRFVTAVPEPVTISLFGAGLGGAIALRRRKRSAQPQMTHGHGGLGY